MRCEGRCPKGRLPSGGVEDGTNGGERVSARGGADHSRGERAVNTSPAFVGAITYCLAYDHWRQSPHSETLGRLLGGEEPRTDENDVVRLRHLGHTELASVLDLETFSCKILCTHLQADSVWQTNDAVQQALRHLWQGREAQYSVPEKSPAG